MGIFLGDTAPSKIFVGDTQISKVFLWDTQVRPVTPNWNWDLTKATLSSTTSISGFSCYAPCFSDDGMKFYYTIRSDNTNWKIYEYDLWTAWDVSTKSGSYTHTMTIGSGNPRYWVYVQNMIFRNNWQYMYVGYFNHPWTVQGYVAQYTLSTPYNIATATLTKSIWTGQYWPWIWVSEDGTEFWFMSDGAYYKQLSTPYMIETATKITNTRTMFKFISSDWKYAYNHPVSSATKQYSLWNGYDFSSWSEVASITQTWSNYCEWLTFNKDWTKLYVLWWGLNSWTVRTYTIS